MRARSVKKVGSEVPPMGISYDTIELYVMLYETGLELININSLDVRSVLSSKDGKHRNKPRMAPQTLFSKPVNPQPNG